MKCIMKCRTKETRNVITEAKIEPTVAWKLRDEKVWYLNITHHIEDYCEAGRRGIPIKEQQLYGSQ